MPPPLARCLREPCGGMEAEAGGEQAAAVEAKAEAGVEALAEVEVEAMAKDEQATAEEAAAEEAADEDGAADELARSVLVPWCCLAKGTALRAASHQALAVRVAWHAATLLA